MTLPAAPCALCWAEMLSVWLNYCHSAVELSVTYIPFLDTLKRYYNLSAGAQVLNRVVQCCSSGQWELNSHLLVFSSTIIRHMLSGAVNTTHAYMLTAVHTRRASFIWLASTFTWCSTFVCVCVRHIASQLSVRPQAGHGFHLGKYQRFTRCSL